MPWQQKQLDSFVLMLCQDGSVGLDLSFVTHLFILNPILDAALERQVVSRAHHMGLGFANPNPNPNPDPDPKP